MLLEILESRILYSGSPAPYIPEAVALETVSALPTHSFSTIDHFTEQISEAPVEYQTHSPVVTLISFDNLSEEEVLTLQPSDNPRSNFSGSSAQDENQNNASASAEVDVDNSLLPEILVL